MSTGSISQYSYGGKKSSRPQSASTNVSIVSTHPVPYVSNQYKREINATGFGPGKQYMCYAFLCFGLCVVFLAAGATLIGLRQQGQLYVSDQVEFVGPLLVALAFVVLGIGVYFVVRARRKSNEARSNIRFHPDGMNGTSATASINGTYMNDTTSITAVSMATASRAGTSVGGSRGGSILMEQQQDELLSGSVTAKGVRAGQRHPHVNTQPAPSRIPEEQRRYKPHRAHHGHDQPDHHHQAPPQNQAAPPYNPQVAQVKKEATF